MVARSWKRGSNVMVAESTAIARRRAAIVRLWRLRCSGGRRQDGAPCVGPWPPPLPSRSSRRPARAATSSPCPIRASSSPAVRCRRNAGAPTARAPARTLSSCVEPCQKTNPNDPSTCYCMPVTNDLGAAVSTMCIESALACIGRGTFCSGTVPAGGHDVRTAGRDANAADADPDDGHAHARAALPVHRRRLLRCQRRRHVDDRLTVSSSGSCRGSRVPSETCARSARTAPPRP